MLEKMDLACLTSIKERREDGTLALAASSLIAFGVMLGAIAIYDNIVKTQNSKNEKKNE